MEDFLGSEPLLQPGEVEPWIPRRFGFRGVAGHLGFHRGIWGYTCSLGVWGKQAPLIVAGFRYWSIGMDGFESLI